MIPPIVPVKPLPGDVKARIGAAWPTTLAVVVAALWSRPIDRSNAQKQTRIMRGGFPVLRMWQMVAGGVGGFGFGVDVVVVVVVVELDDEDPEPEPPENPPFPAPPLLPLLVPPLPGTSAKMHDVAPVTFTVADANVRSTVPFAFLAAPTL